MTLLELITTLRTSILDDTGGDVVTDWTVDDSDCLWSNDELASYFDRAQREYCRRRAIRDTSSTVTDVTLVAGTAAYALDPVIKSVEEIAVVSNGDPIDRLYQDEYPADINGLTWADGSTKYYTLLERTLTLYPTPTADDALKLTVRRSPTATLTWASSDESPEINADDHDALLDWAAHLAYLKHGADTRDPDLSGRHQGLFTQRVGPRRNTQEQFIRAHHANRRLRTRAQPF